MCDPASFVVTKGQVYWSHWSDRHDDIIGDNRLKDVDVRGNATCVRIEISPPSGDLSLPPSKWKYKLDQDMKPTWYDAVAVERRCRDALQAWRKQKLVLKGERKITGREHVYVYGDGRVCLYGHKSRAKLYGNSSAELYSASAADLYDTSSADVFGEAWVMLYGSSFANLYGTSRSYIHGSSSVVLHYKSLASLYGDSSAKLSDESSAILRNNSSAKLYHNSSAQLYGHSSATLNHNTLAVLHRNASATSKSEYAVLVDRRGGGVPVCIVGEGELLAKEATQ